MGLIKCIATQGPTGYIPGGGTLASAQAALFIWYCMPHNSMLYIGLLLFLCIASFLIINRALSFFSQKDPRQIVLDESLGCMIAMIGLTSFHSMVCAFLLFRILDIAKPSFISSVEKLPAAWGVLADDCVAGLVTNLVIHFLHFLTVC